MILESTSPVGTTEKLASWLSEERPDLRFPTAGSREIDVNLAYCPERVLPGSIVSELIRNDRVVGGLTPRCAEKARHLYESFALAHHGAIRMGLIGAGGFAKGMHLPNLQELKDDFVLRAVASRTGHNAQSTAKRFGAKYSTTDHNEILKDQDIDAVIIATRHDTHASLALDTLRAGKHVLLEKPLALTEQELQEIESFYSDDSRSLPVLLTGFNRRFSVYAQHIAKVIEVRTNPLIINYRMNAGYIPLDHWVHGPEGGGRNRGEACHIYDLFTFLTGAKVVSVQANCELPSNLPSLTVRLQ